MSSSLPPTYEALQQPSHTLGLYNEADDDDFVWAKQWMVSVGDVPTPPQRLPPSVERDFAAFGCKLYALLPPPSEGSLRGRFQGHVVLPPKSAYGTSAVVTRRGCKDVCLFSNFPLHFALYDRSALRGVYYEIEVEVMKGVITLGMTPLPFPQFRLPGWERGIGLHLDDMRIFLLDDRGGRDMSDQRPNLALRKDSRLKGQVFGCGYDYSNNTVFYTLNGQKLQDEFPATSTYLNFDIHAAIGVSGRDGMHLSSEENKFVVNFGGVDFAWKEANADSWCRRSEGTFNIVEIPVAVPPRYAE